MMAHLQQGIQSQTETLESHQSQVTDVEHTLHTSEHSVHPLQETIVDGWNEDLCLQEGLKPLSREREEWKGRTQELTGFSVQCTDTTAPSPERAASAVWLIPCCRPSGAPAPSRRSCGGWHPGNRGKERHHPDSPSEASLKGLIWLLT